MIIEVNSLLPLNEIMFIPFVSGVIMEGLAIINTLSSMWGSYDSYQSAKDADFSGAYDSVKDWFTEAGDFAETKLTESLDWIEQQYGYATDKATTSFNRETEQAGELKDLGIESAELDLSQTGERAQFKGAGQAYALTQKADVMRGQTKGLVSCSMEENIDYSMGQIGRQYDIATTQASDTFDITKEGIETRYEHTMEDLTDDYQSTMDWADLSRAHGLTTTTSAYDEQMFGLTNEYDRMMADIRTSEYAAEQQVSNSIWNLFG